jgi:hypothetical protein
LLPLYDPAYVTRHLPYSVCATRSCIETWLFTNPMQGIYKKCRAVRGFIREVSAVIIISIQWTNGVIVFHQVCGETLQRRLSLVVGNIWINEGKAFQHHDPLHHHVLCVAVSFQGMNHLIKRKHKLTVAHGLLLGVSTLPNKILTFIHSQ